jgi:hypothetical protein
VTNIDLVSEGFNLNKQQRGLIIRVWWVTLVSCYMLWTLGAFAFFGLKAPFASAHDVENTQKLVINQTAPQTAGLKAIISANIVQLEEDVDTMTAERNANPAKWTELKQLKLTRLQQRLESQRLAFAQILQSERALLKSEK